MGTNIFVFFIAIATTTQHPSHFTMGLHHFFRQNNESDHQTSLSTDWTDFSTIAEGSGAEPLVTDSPVYKSEQVTDYFHTPARVLGKLRFSSNMETKPKAIKSSIATVKSLKEWNGVTDNINNALDGTYLNNL